MLFGAWVAGLALLGLGFHTYLQERDHPNRHLAQINATHDTSEIVLRYNRAGNYVVPGSIHDPPVVFMLDTGASTVALSQELAHTLKLPLRPGGRVHTANGVVDAWSTRIDSLTLGPFQVRNIRALVLPNMPGDQVLLGMTVLKRFDMVQQGQTLTLRQPHGG